MSQSDSEPGSSSPRLRSSIVEFSHQPHPCIDLQDLDVASLPHLKRINSAVLPTNYSPQWYRDSLKVGQLAKLAWFDGIPVGAIRCAVDESSASSAPPRPSNSNNNKNNESKILNSTEPGSEVGFEIDDIPVPKIYIMTLAVLSPYRSYGIATLLLAHIVAQAQLLDIHEVYVHAWTENEEAIEWYEKRGFVKHTELIKGYYRKLLPPDAYLLKLIF